MDTKELTLSEQCETLMDIVVESRKQYGKMCRDYGEKASLIDNKILQLKVETISNYHFKPKTSIPDVDLDGMSLKFDNFKSDLLEKRKQCEDLKKVIKDTLVVVTQLKRDSVSKNMHQPHTAEAMLRLAKEKI